jgi:hypothetical protein
MSNPSNLSLEELSKNPEFKEGLAQAAAEEKAPVLSDPRKFGVRGEFTHRGVKGVELICPQCHRHYNNCHPTEPCFCGCNPRYPVKLVTWKDIEAVQKCVMRWYMMTGKFFTPQ